MRSELRFWGRSWWCRGGGAAVLFLLAVVSLFRDHRDAIFWIAVLFFVGHTVHAVLRYRRERRVRASATVIRHHDTDPPIAKIFFIPQPVNSLIPLKNPQQQTKKAI